MEGWTSSGTLWTPGNFSFGVFKMEVKDLKKVQDSALSGVTVYYFTHKRNMTI